MSRQEVEEAFLNGPVELDYQFAEEERWVAVGVTNRGRFLTIIWTLRGNAARIVTAFEADKGDASVFLSQRGS